MLNPWPEPKLKLNDNNLLPLPDEEVVSEDELEAPSRDDLDTDSEDGHDNKIEVNASMSLDDTIIDHEIEAYEQDTDKIETVSFDLVYLFTVREFNEKMRAIVYGFKILPVSDSSVLSFVNNANDECSSQQLAEYFHVSASSTTTNLQLVRLDQIISTDILASLEEISLNDSAEVIHEFQAKNFGADKGVPTVCTVCYRSNHSKSNCPELSIPNMVDVPELCTFLEKYKPTKECIEKRETILNYLETEFRKKYPNCSVRAYGSFYNGFGFQLSDLDKKETTIQVLENLAQSMESDKNMFKGVEIMRSARVPIIRSIHIQSNIEIDISLNNILTCDIGDASHGTLSSYAYIIMVIHFLQQIQPPVVPILQQLNDNQSTNTSNVRKYADWNIYFYDDLTQLNKVWNGYGLNKLSSGELWIELLRYYTELFDYEKNIVTIRQYEPLSRLEKGWFRQTIAIEDPFILTHNLADTLFLKS
ncbi:unnamed protein product [Rotaria sp. Silwood1]|nr:unnamed protein product [Rotaria sp. Silwood1]